MQYKNLKKRIFDILAILTGTFILIIPALYNGFPIVYSDTSTYIVSGFELIPPFDRPITYGLFIRLASFFGTSLWFVVIIQSFILVLLLYILSKEFITSKYHPVFFVLMMVITGLFTGIPWVSSQLLADIFTPVTFLTILVILLKNDLSKISLISFYFLYYFSVATHITHFNMCIIVLIVLLILRKLNFFSLKSVLNIKKLTILLILTVAVYPIISAPIAKSKHVFFMGALVEHGIIKKYLDENCDEKKYELCNYKDSLPGYGYEFMWEEFSPVYKMGGWKEVKEEYTEIIKGTFSKPKYIGWHLTESLKATFLQLAHFRPGDGNGVFLEGTKLYERIAIYFPRQLNAFKDSKQNKNQLRIIKPFSYIIYIASIISLFLIIILLIKNPVFSPKYLLFIFTLCLAILLNAWFCGTFSCVADRFGIRMEWMIVFLLFVSLKKFSKH